MRQKTLSCQVVPDKPVGIFNKNMRVKQYLTGCFTYCQGQHCQAVLDKPVKTMQQKYACQAVLDKAVIKLCGKKHYCQAVLDKPVLLTIKNNHVKQYLTSLFYLSKITLSSST